MIYDNLLRLPGASAGSADDSAPCRVYVSGPISHYDLAERKQFFSFYENLLRLCGYEPVNPFNNPLHLAGNEAASWREHMLEDLKMLLGCNAILMLPDWELSKGCKLELDVASSCGLRVIFPNDLVL